MDKSLRRIIKATIFYLSFLPMMALPVGELRAQQILPGVLNPVSSNPAHHFSVVQSGTCGIASAGVTTSLNCTWGTGGFTSGDLVYVIGGYYVIAPSAASTGTWTPMPTTQTTGYGNTPTGIITGMSGGTTTFTITIGSQYISPSGNYLAILEISGVNSGTPVDQNTGLTGLYFGITNTGSVTTVDAADEVCGIAISTNSGDTSLVAGSGYTAVSLPTVLNPGLSSPPVTEFLLFECSNSVLAPGTYNPGVAVGVTEYNLGTIAFNLN